MFDEITKKKNECLFCPHPLSDHFQNELLPNERRCNKCGCIFDYENELIRKSNALVNALRNINRE